ncbi:hypothetical protein H8356DRAFT_1639583 [Neocallimastix lanati (nom. inval.)]|nr:hypothetical protein H8356DRAFT_1639583 [Neocallimastix sp. JGI-2020a]
MDKLSLGTKLAIAGTTAACLPSLISLYYDRLGLGRPPVDLLKYFSSFHVIYRAPRFHFCSNIDSIILHMFHHMDIHHLKANLLCLVSSALSANLGFFGTINMLLAGGVVGVTTDIIDRCKIRSNTIAVVGKTGIDVINNPMPAVKSAENLWSWFYNKIANPELFFSLCGLDAAVCAIIGVDAYKLYRESGSEISDAWNDALGLKRTNGSFHIVGRIGIMATEIATLVLEPHVKHSHRLYGEERHVGVAGRISSFLFGFTVYAAYDLVKDYWEKNRNRKKDIKKIKGRIAKETDGKKIPFKEYTMNDDYFF